MQSRSIAVLYYLAHVAAWKPYNLRDLVHISWVGSALCRFLTTYHTAGYVLDYVGGDLSDMWKYQYRPQA